MGALNAKIGNVNLGLKNVMCRHGLGTRNENGDMFIELCVNCNLVIGSSLFPHKDIRSHGWPQIGVPSIKLTILLLARNGRDHSLMSAVTGKLM